MEDYLSVKEIREDILRQLKSQGLPDEETYKIMAPINLLVARAMIGPKPKPLPVWHYALYGSVIWLAATATMFYALGGQCG